MRAWWWGIALGALACDGSVDDVGPPSLAPLVRGEARLVGGGEAACSNGEPTAERWCAFTLPGRAPKSLELWVVNVAAAARGGAVCDGSSADCRRLTARLWTDEPIFGPSHPTAHRFEGDTLFFHAEAAPLADAFDVYQGPVWAWRPEWPAARRLTSDRGTLCSGHRSAAVATCIDGYVAPPPGVPVEIDILAGPLEAAASGALPLARRIRPLRSAGENAWRAAFSPDGRHFALSSLEGAAGERESLRVWRTDELGAAPGRVVRDDVSRFAIANDGARIYYLREFTYARGGAAAGTLAMADFPSGANPVSVAPRVGVFEPVGPRGAVDRGVALLVDIVEDMGTLRLMPDRNRPAELATIDRDVLSFVVSPDGRYAHYVKPDRQSNPDGWLARGDGQGRPCVLNVIPGSPADQVRFPEHAGLVLWTEFSGDLGGMIGWAASPDGCGERVRFGERVRAMRPVSDRLVVYGDGEARDGTVTLRHARLPDRGRRWPAEGGAAIADGAGPAFAVVAGGRSADIVFEARSGDGAPGLVRFGPVALE